MKQTTLHPSDGESDYGQAVGERLRFLRKKHGLTLNFVADSLGISYQQFQKYEKGASRLSLEYAQKFANLIGTPISSVADVSSSSTIAGMSDNGQKALDALSEIDETLSELLGAYHSIQDPEKKKNFVNLVKEMAKNMQD
jgi:transcriptional regulator with XRE-family HTH domain